MNLTDQYRPTVLDDVVGQEAAVSKIRFLSNRGLGGRAFWIAGEWAEEIDAGECTVKRITEWETSLRCKPLGGKGWAMLVNEAHGLRRDAVRQFLVTLERLPPYAWHCSKCGTGATRDQLIESDGRINRRQLLILSDADVMKQIHRERSTN